MAKEKQVFSSEEVAHVWARQSQESGRDTGSRIYFNGPTLYSYGSHYKVGCIHPTTGIVLLNDSSNSQTTNKHRRYAQSAASHKPCIYVSSPFTERELEYDKKNCILSNAVSFIDEIKELVAKQTKAKKVDYLPQLENQLRQLVNFLDRFEGYSELLDWQLVWVNKYKSEGVLAFFALFVELDQVRVEELKRKREEYEAKQEANRIEARKSAEKSLKYWKSKEFTEKFSPRFVSNNLYNLGYVALRIDDEGNVETTKGIGNIKKADCKKLWKSVQMAVTKKQPIRFGDKLIDIPGTASQQIQVPAMQVNGYDVDFITSKGDLNVGCHFIPFKELKYAAKQLGFITQ